MTNNHHNELNSSELQEAKNRWKESRKRFNTHIANIPLLLAVTWFFGIIIGEMLFSISAYFENRSAFLNAFLIPSMFGIGLSGFIMLVTGEYMSKRGILYKGLGSRLLGILLLLVGWGAILVMTYFHF